MNVQHPDIKIRYIRTKNKTRKLVTYSSDDCELRVRHKRINDFIEARFIPSIFSKGYVKNRSIYHNALAHLYNDYFIMLDIKDFFPHICHKQLADKLFYEMNLLSHEQISMKECKNVIELCSVSSRGLPLGFITSPLLSNVYMKEFDGIFFGQLKKLGLENPIYTRYVDDITVSFKYSNRIPPIEVENQVVDLAQSLLSKYGLQLNNRKKRSYNLNISNHVRITGINITKQPDNKRLLTVGRATKNELYWGAIDCLKSRDPEKIAHIKGMQSFILSIEKNGYEKCYSKAMIQQIRNLGFFSLKELIDSLD